MIPSASSRRSSRAPGVAPNSSPWASCSRSNQAAPRPRIARPADRWSRVTASFAVSPGLRNVLAPTSSPSSTRSVRTAHAARMLQPSSEGCSHGPSMASRWSQVMRMSQPSRSSATPASRRPGQSLCLGPDLRAETDRIGCGRSAQLRTRARAVVTISSVCGRTARSSASLNGIGASFAATRTIGASR